MAIKIALIVHPGDWLKTEMIEANGLTVSAAAGQLGVTRQALSNLLNKKAGVSPDMAIRFEKMFGLSADTLILMQANYDIRMARKRAKAIHVVPFARAA